MKLGSVSPATLSLFIMIFNTFFSDFFEISYELLDRLFSISAKKKWF